jgi:hypothetical protein
MKNIYYTINIENFDKHQAKLKRGHKAVLISTGFLSDPKIQMLNPTTKLLFLSCILVGGELTKSQIEVSHKSLCFQSGVKSGSLQSQLDLLQSLQLLSYTKITPLINRIEKKGKERKVKEEKGTASSTNVAPVEILPQKTLPELLDPDPPPTKTNLVIAAYCSGWKKSYNSQKNPTILPKDAKMMKTLAESRGVDEAIKMVEAYLRMADPWFIKKRHDVSTLLANLNTITHFMETGKVVTHRDIKRVQDKVESDNLMKMIEEGKV